MRMDYAHDWVDLSVDWAGRDGPVATITLTTRADEHGTEVLFTWRQMGPELGAVVAADICDQVLRAVQALLGQQFMIIDQLSFPDPF